MISALVRQILEQHSRALMLFARQWCDCPEDCLQNAVIKISRQSEVPKHWLPWVYRIVKNEAISLRRKSVSRCKHEQKAAEEREAWFDAEARGNFDGEDVSRALQMIPDEQREVIVARIWGELNYEQIAATFDCSLSTAYQRFQSGLEKMKQILNRSDQGLEAINNHSVQPPSCQQETDA